MARWTKKLRVWLAATRPKTLAAAVAPVTLGTAVAYDQGVFHPWLALTALAAGMLLQVGTNFANDYYDFLQGADTAERVGPPRAMQSGLLSAREMEVGTAVVFSLALVAGLVLRVAAGWVVFAIGLAALAAGVAYTAGDRHSLGYLGLGDVTVFVFCGPLAVAGSAYVQLVRWVPEAFTTAIPMGCLAVAVLAVNNYRDADTDRASGKRTLAVRLGRGFVRGEYFLLLVIAFAVPTLQWWTGAQEPWVLLPWLSAPLAWPPLRKLLAPIDGPSLNRALGETARLMLAFGLLYALGIVLGH